MRWRNGAKRILLLVGIGVLADFAAAFVLTALVALSLGSSFRLPLFMTGIMLMLIGLTSGGLPEAALYRNPPFPVPSRYDRPSLREDVRDRTLTRTQRPLGEETLAGLALMLLALVLVLLPSL